MLGLYYMTFDREGEPGEGSAFTGVGELEQALEIGAVSLHSRVKCRYRTVTADGEPVTLTVENHAGADAAFRNCCRGIRPSVFDAIKPVVDQA